MIIFQRRVCLEPRFLDQNLEHHLLNKVNETIVGECTKEYGYILSIYRIVEILDNKISPANSDIVFTVSIEVENLKPEKDSEYEGKICMILPTGIFLVVEDRLKVLIPKNYLEDYEMKQMEGSGEMFYVNRENGEELRKEDIVRVSITKTKYSNQEFSCFGRKI